MTPDGWIDLVVLLLVLAGALLCLTAAIGLLRFRDVPTRLHAATKPQVLGFLLICVAIALSLRSIEDSAAETSSVEKRSSGVNVVRFGFPSRMNATESR